MPVFSWEGKSTTGQIRKGEMNASHADEVSRRLRQQDFSDTKIKKKSSGSTKSTGKIKIRTLVVFTRQFATMVDAGVPIVQCLELLGEAEPNRKFRVILQQVKAAVESGSTLAGAMQRHPGAFNNLYCALITAGEEAGILDTVMQRLAIEMEKSMKLRRRIKGAFTYPSIVLVVALIVVTGLLYYVIPTFAAMFMDMGGGELPLPTQFVIALSEFLQDNVLIIGGVVFLLVLVTRGLFANSASRAVIDKYTLKLPLFGSLIQKGAVARFTRTLGTMVASGVPIVDSLEIVSKTTGNMTIEKAILYVKDRISEGQNMVDPLAATKVFPHMVVQMIGVGESTGALDTMLNKIADFYEEEVDVAVENLTSLLEPLLMVFLGGAVGGLLIAMYLPIFHLAGNIKTD
jgi:type IV pilus assembly protein PilC